MDRLPAPSGILGRGNGKMAEPDEGGAPATNETVAAGVILDTEVQEPEFPTKTERSPNVRWQGTRLTRRRRWETLGHGGATVWFTGLPGAGKSTVAAAVEERLIAAGRPAFLLDGDNLRHGLNGDLGFDESARSENVRRTAHVAKLLAESGTIALVSLISPYASDRQAAAALHRSHDLHFIEVYVNAPLELCEERDPKGLYARARAGELAGLTGVGAPYEPPSEPDLVLGAGEETIDSEVVRVLAMLIDRGLIPGGS
jgi:bifunctional enzyme CysN/CysC